MLKIKCRLFCEAREQESLEKVRDALQKFEQALRLYETTVGKNDTYNTYKEIYMAAKEAGY